MNSFDIEKQKTELIYQEFSKSLQELKAIKKGKKTADYSLDDLINDLEMSSTENSKK